ncbi:MAG: DUF4375 domain-containing protein [Opitutaceae bacterium]|nr:DUF4375 domain-containing protein [Opitutaceae bacterium]
MRILTTLCLVLSLVASIKADDKKFLDAYNGQSTDQLIVLASSYRIDSLVLAFEQALEQKKAAGKKLSQPEIDILAIEAMEREVNNGGYRQFFTNVPGSHAAVLPAALERIGCPLAAKISSEALVSLKISGPVTAAKIEAAAAKLDATATAELGKLDGRYFQNTEPIAEKLFAYIQAKRNEIVLK